MAKSGRMCFFSNPWYYRPLGFRYGILGAWNIPTICINITTGNYKVELMVYSFTTGASLTASDLSTDPYNLQSNGVTNVHGQSKLYQCFIGPTNPQATMHLSIYCPRDNCEEGNMHLLWRLRKSGLPSTHKEEFANENSDICGTIGNNLQWPDQIVDNSPTNATVSGYDNSVLQVSVMVGTLLSVLFAVFQ